MLRFRRSARQCDTRVECFLGLGFGVKQSSAPAWGHASLSSPLQPKKPLKMSLRWNFFFSAEMDTCHIPEIETFHHVGDFFFFLFKLHWLHLNIFQNKRRVVLLKKCQNKNFQLSKLSSDRTRTGPSAADGFPRLCQAQEVDGWPKNEFRNGEEGGSAGGCQKGALGSGEQR